MVKKRKQIDSFLIIIVIITLVVVVLITNFDKYPTGESGKTKGIINKSLNRCWDNSDCLLNEYCYKTEGARFGVCKPFLEDLDEVCMYGSAFGNESGNISCFANNSLQPGYFGPINLEPYDPDRSSWTPILLANDFSVFHSYGDPEQGNCIIPIIGGYDTVLLNDWSLHLQKYGCNGGLGASIWDKYGNKTVAISLNEAYDDAKYQNLHHHHSMWPLQNGNFLIMGGHRIYFDEAVSLGKNPDPVGFTQQNEFGEFIDSGFFIEVRPAKPGDDDGCVYESGHWKCRGYIEYEWYMADNFVQDYNSSNKLCSDYDYMNEPSGCYALSNCTDTDGLSLSYMNKQSCNENVNLEGNGNPGIWESEIYKYPHMIDINLPYETPGIMAMVDWAHLNTIHWTPSIPDGGFCPENDGCILISSRTLGDGEMYIIGKTSNKIIYRCCNPDNYGRGISAGGDSYERITTHQHGGNWIPPKYPGAGNIIWFNNDHYSVPCEDIETKEECESCTAFQQISNPDYDPLSACKWFELEKDGGYCSQNVENPWEEGYCANSAVVEIKPDYYIEQDSLNPFQFYKMYIMDRIYGSAPYYYGENNNYPEDCEEGFENVCTINTGNYANKFLARAEGGVFKLPNGNVFISHQIYHPKYEVGDPYGVPELLAMIGGMPVITEPRSFKVVPTCTKPSAKNYDPASIYMYHIDDGSCIYMED